MAMWCEVDDVTERVSGSPAQHVVIGAIECASSLLSLLSGGIVRPLRSVTAVETIDHRGVISMRNYQPVRRVDSVMIDGQLAVFKLSPGGAYVSVSDRAVGRVATVAAQIGTGVPVPARRAAAVLATELVRVDPVYAITEADDVREDPRLSSITRQGVTWGFRDVTEAIKESLAGLYEVDMFLRAVNPSGARYQPKVVAP